MSLSGINLLSDQLERIMTTKFTLWTDTFFSSKFEKCPPLYSPLHLSLCALLFHGFLQLKYFFHKLQLNQNQRRRTTKQGQSPSKVSANLLFMTSALTGKGMIGLYTVQTLGTRTRVCWSFFTRHFLTKVQSCPKSVLLPAENAAIQEI